MRIYKSVTELVGNTPLVELCAYEREINSKARLFAKLEYFNPAGSVKDRAAKSMIEDYEKKGVLKKGSAIIEPTSGNTGIGLASIAATKGYKVILTMPETMSVERRKLLAAYGAEIVLTDGKKGMSGAIEKAEELAKQIPNSVIAGQFVNPANPLAHFNTTGPEIWNDTEGQVDIFVSGVGTGGTLTGVAKYLKEKNSKVKIVAVEPYASPVLSGGSAASHGLQGIGAGFVPQILDADLIDEIICVKEEDAYSTGRFLAQKEGILVGITSGAAVYATGEIAKKEENRGKNIVILLPDTGERYLSTPMFENT